MKNSAPPANMPFWVDEPVTTRISFNPQYMKFFKLWIYVILVFAVMMIAIIFSFLSKLFALFYIILVCVTVFLNYYYSTKRKVRIKNIASIQQHAKELLHASTIDSAVHVAGHPLLQRDQPVILGVTADSLVICNYDSPEPVDRIPFTDIRAAYTVVYDDERIPHIDIIDSSAQALQLMIQRDGKSWTCLFRRMQKVRPIDWYQAIQQARGENTK